MQDQNEFDRNNPNHGNGGGGFMQNYVRLMYVNHIVFRKRNTIKKLEREILNA